MKTCSPDLDRRFETLSTVSPKKADVTAFIDDLVGKSVRGEFSAIVDSLRGYWDDKNAHPWHLIYRTLKRDKALLNDRKRTTEILVRLRDAIFCALDVISLSLSLDVSASEILSIVLSGESWTDGRRRARAHCAELLRQKIEKGDTQHIVPAGLIIDGLGFLVLHLKKAELKAFREAIPKEKDGKYDFRALTKT
ncbi:MAG: hypothetical protein QXQ81_08645, partial [Candidatus Thorarchaeota archaeon]